MKHFLRFLLATIVAIIYLGNSKVFADDKKTYSLFDPKTGVLTFYYKVPSSVTTASDYYHYIGDNWQYSYKNKKYAKNSSSERFFSVSGVQCPMICHPFCTFERKKVYPIPWRSLNDVIPQYDRQSWRSLNEVIPQCGSGSTSTRMPSHCGTLSATPKTAGSRTADSLNHICKSRPGASREGTHARKCSNKFGISLT